MEGWASGGILKGVSCFEDNDDELSWDALDNAEFGCNGLDNEVDWFVSEGLEFDGFDGKVFACDSFGIVNDD
jgi:hypothetical protein